jgi:hypothetical protein
MTTQCLYVLRAFPFKQEFGGGFGARVFDVTAKQSTLAPSRFDSYEAARDWAIAQGHTLMADRPYRRASVKQSKANQNRFYVANLWA